jgi:hypothetical protein
MIAVDAGATPATTAPATPQASPLQGVDAPPVEPVAGRATQHTRPRPTRPTT